MMTHIGRLMQENHKFKASLGYKFKVRLNYIARSRLRQKDRDTDRQTQRKANKPGPLGILQRELSEY